MRMLKKLNEITYFALFVIVFISQMASMVLVVGNALAAVYSHYVVSYEVGDPAYVLTLIFTGVYLLACKELMNLVFELQEKRERKASEP